MCTCGNTTTHSIAHRRTADDKGVILWSDGDLTFAFGGIPGIGKLRDRQRGLAVGWLVINEVCIYDAAEMPRLVQIARKLPAGALPGDLRRAFSASDPRKPSLPGHWEIMSTDPRDGRPTCRAWIFPALSAFADLAIWHERGVYTLMQRVIGRCPNGTRPTTRADNVVESTGFTATSLRAAFAMACTIVNVA